MTQPRPFADTVIKVSKSGQQFRAVPCRVFPDDVCVTCGPDYESWIDADFPTLTPIDPA